MKRVIFRVAVAVLALLAVTAWKGNGMQVRAGSLLEASIPDVDLGVGYAGVYTSNDCRKTINMSITGTQFIVMSEKRYKIELTAGDTDAFLLWISYGGVAAAGGVYTAGTVKPVEGLAPGTYTATMTMSYDDDVTGSSWTVLDTSTVTFTVKPPTKLYTISFYANGGFGTYASKTVNSGTTYTLPSNPFRTPEEKGFDCWEVRRTGQSTIQMKPGEKITVTSDVKLYAVWKTSEPPAGEIPYDVILNNATATPAYEGYIAGDYRYGFSLRVLGTERLICDDYHLKVEWISGSTSVFSIWESKGGTMSPGNTYSLGAISVCSGLSAGEYTATFGVYYDEDGTKTEKDWVLLDTGKVIFKVLSGAASYKVEFLLNGGESGNPSPIYVSQGGSLTIPKSSPKRRGYYFRGWSESRISSVPAYKSGDVISNIRSNREVYAVWQLRKYKVTYQLNGGKNHADNPSQYTVTSPAIYLKPATKNGYRFDGWYTDAALTKKSSGIATNSIGDRTFYAKFTKIAEVKLSFSRNGGSGNAPAAQTVPAGTSVTIPKVYPTREGYYFMGWSTDKNATAAQYKGGDTVTVNADMVLHAVWKPRTNTISFDANGGSGTLPEPIKVLSGKTATIGKSSMSREGYWFLGWSTDESATAATYKTGSEISVLKDTVLYAVWKKK